jgi:hypothetical protein
MITDPRALEVVSARDTGQIPVSIGTSLALEGAFGILEDNHDQSPIINRVDVVYINLRTMVRNLVGAIAPDDLPSVFPEDMAATLINEITIVEQAIASATNGRVKTQVYLCNYRDIPKRYPFGILKNANTDRQRMAALREENTVFELKTLLQQQPQIRIIETDTELKPDPRKVLMLTSYAVDLLQRYSFSALTLLESHTGAVKSQAMWHSKLTGGKELTNIPFDQMTIQFFGDGGNLFTGFPIKYRRVLLDIATKNRWNTLTTKDYIISCIQKAGEPELEKLIRNLYSKN